MVGATTHRCISRQIWVNKSGDIEKYDQTDSPEISDRGETSKIPLSLQGTDGQTPIHIHKLFLTKSVTFNMKENEGY